MISGELGHRRGIENSVQAKGSYYNYPLINYGTHYGSGRNVSIHNYAYHKGSGQNIGIYNKLYSNGSGEKIGMYTLLGDDRSENAGSVEPMYGSQTIMTHQYRPEAYGSYIDIDAKNYSSSDVTYGYYVHVGTWGSNNAKVYGVYSDVSQSRPGIYYAGYFNGDVTVNGKFVQTSDATLKDNVEDITSALSLLNKLHPTSYRFKKGNRFGYDPAKRRYGFLAQEVEKVLPALVEDVHHPQVKRAATVPADEDMPENVVGASNSRRGGTSGASEGSEQRRAEVLHPAEVLKGINYIDFIPILTQAIKEQQVEIDSLRSLINSTLGTVTDSLPALPVGVGNNFFGNSRTTARDTTGEGDEEVRRLAEENGELQESVSQLRKEMRQLHEEMTLLKNCTDCRTSAPIFNAATPTGGQVNIYPNPARNKVTINNPLSTAYEVRVLSADGREFARLQVEGRVKRIDTVDWPAGTYLFEILEGKVVLDRQPVVVTR